MQQTCGHGKEQLAHRKDSSSLAVGAALQRELVLRYHTS